MKLDIAGLLKGSADAVTERASQLFDEASLDATPFNQLACVLVASIEAVNNEQDSSSELSGVTLGEVNQALSQLGIPSIAKMGIMNGVRKVFKALTVVTEIA